ncbi:bifunctional phosphoribosylaminoimidazolecarboxamide formyltransferase/IMP cyclohydrolase [Pelagibacterales bacterium SAG-MED17]|nr:bifunctional phosphoribosylaminoimidazolecarboxamide formyltransferase/IMP cyclohydrolase [Pelagibacterales bacterium SAG-MED17]
MSYKIKKAVISLSDKSEIKLVLNTLKKFKVNVISSGGTSKEIKKLGYECTDVSEYTNSDEILDGRVKTLHPKLYAGILNKRDNVNHKKELKKNNYDEIDLVIVNFYPFEETLKRTKNQNKLIENIDIGGPTLVRAAAKNYKYTTVLTSPHQYKEFILDLEKNKGSTSLELRKKLSQEAFNLTAYYDSVISEYLNNTNNDHFPQKKTIYGNLVEVLRYGENPHQQAAIYSKNNNLDISQLSGKKLSYNNYNDIFSALNISRTLPKNNGTVIVKHANPCGVSINNNKIESYKEALACDPISAFGGIVSCNFRVDKKTALELNKIFLEVIIGIGFDKDSLKILKKKKNLRLIDASKLSEQSFDNVNSHFDSLLFQSMDNKIFTKDNFKVVSKIKPTKKILDNLFFAFNVCRNVKSNAIVLTRNSSTVGIGSGQPSRLDSCKIAIEKMNRFQKISENDIIIGASDAFFPFVDGIETLVQNGVSAIIQPSGSIRDKEIIKFADKLGIILVFSKTRHFKH